MPTQIEGSETRIRSRVAEIVGPQRFKVWFNNSTKFTIGDGFLKVGVPNLFIGGWIEDHFADAIAEASRDVLGHDVEVSFAIDPVLFRNMRKTQLNSQAAFIEKNAERVIRNTRSAADGNGNGIAGLGHAIATNGKDTSGFGATSRKLRGRLEDFVVGPGNRLAYSVAQSVAENPNRETSPVFIHSSVGLGKSHLLQAIANAMTEKSPTVQWAYLSGEEFTNQFLYALREKRLDAFRHRYRHIDVLLLDDMQFLANKKATQEEFFHTFNAIDAGGKRVIMASDAHPKMIGDLSESLVNRIMSGMIVRIDRPDKTVRCEILRRRATAAHQVVPEPVIEYIAEKVHSNIRELEGCLLKLLAFASLIKQPITMALAKQALEDHLKQTGKILTVSDIEHSVAMFFGLTPADLHTSRKSRTIALARNIAMYLARKHTELSFPEIARLMGNKNHTTVLLACRRITNHLKQDAVVSWQTAAGTQERSITELIRTHEEQLPH